MLYQINFMKDFYCKKKNKIMGERKMEYIYERKINYYETDKMGVVHHSNYIRFWKRQDALGWTM